METGRGGGVVSQVRLLRVACTHKHTNVLHTSLQKVEEAIQGVVFESLVNILFPEHGGWDGSEVCVLTVGKAIRCEPLTHPLSPPSSEMDQWTV